MTTPVSALMIAGDRTQRAAIDSYGYTACSGFSDVLAASRTERLLQFTAEIDSYPRAEEIRGILANSCPITLIFGSFQRLDCRMKSFLLRELLARTPAI